MKKLFTILVLISFFICFIQGQEPLITKNSVLSDKVQEDTFKALLEKYGPAHTERIQRGLFQVTSLWTKKDGKAEDFIEFCKENFIADPAELKAAALKLAYYDEILSGMFNRMGLKLQWNLQVESGELAKIDYLFGSYDPSANLAEDLFQNKIAFYVLLNFPCYTLAEKYQHGEKWTREEWAMARIGDMFDSRVPPKHLQNYSKLLTETDNYIAEYNIHLGNLVDENMKTYFRPDLVLISHWGLRDELKAQYAQPEGFARQNMIYEVMKKIISQEIPKNVIGKGDYLWNPKTNQLFQKDGTEVEKFETEFKERYNRILQLFKALHKLDKYFPNYNTAIKRAFDMEMELSVEEIENVFDEFLRSPISKQAAALIEKRLGRKLQPFDIWYDGFKPRSGISQEVLDKKVQERYPTLEAFEKDIPNILMQLGFEPKLAHHLGSKISVDPARGAGHAAGAEMRGFNAHLRTRVPKNGMDYKGFNIAMHELGHNIEQVMTLYDVDYYALHGVPSTAFTEAWAFTLQSRDLKVLGMESPNPNFKHFQALDSYWSTREIMGVSLVDIKLWQWMYKNKVARAEDVRDATIQIAKEVWNKYYAETFGVQDSPILGIYSHMVAYPLYLSAYPVGHLIEFQLDKQIEGKNLGEEMKRIYTYGCIIPQLWMKNAVGSPLSSQPMLECAAEALKHIKE